MKNSTLILDYRNMKVVKTFLILLAFLGTGISSVLAQSGYIITGSGTQFTATGTSGTISTNKPIQEVIDAIKLDALGADCIIQFGNGTNTLNTGTANITFDGGSIGKDWGLITLTGKLTSACNGYNKGPVYLINRVSINSNADITGTASGDFGVTILNNSTGTLTISGGTVLLNSDWGMAIYNQSTGTIQISDGVVKAIGAGAMAITSFPKGKIIVSGNAEITSSNINEYSPGTIFIADDGDGSNACLEITGGKIENTADKGVAIANLSTGTIDISAGTVTAVGDAIVNNSTGAINISGTAQVSTTTTTAAAKSAIYNPGAGKINISGGTVSGGQSYGIYNNGTGEIGVSGGTVTSVRYAIWNNSAGTITISGGTVTAANNAIFNVSSGTVNISDMANVFTTHDVNSAIYSPSASTGNINISGGKVYAKGGYAINNSVTGTLKISGGICFAYGTGVTNVIGGSYTLSGNTVIVAWNESAGRTEYTVNTRNDIYKLPAAATAIWAKQGIDHGISVTYNTNTGFIPLAGITVNDGTGVNQLTMDNGQLKIYPNPTMGQLTIENGELRIKNIEVFDINGRKLYQHSTLNSQLSTQIDVSHLSAGVYFVKISTENGDVVKKVVKE